VLSNPWLEPENYVSKSTVADPVEGCENLKFEPELQFGPSPASEGGTAKADEPTGATVGLRVPQPETGAATTQPGLKDLVMTLPKGMTVSSSGADGLQACTNAQFWPSAKAEAEEAEHKVPAQPSAAEQAAAERREPTVSAKCPSGSQVGTTEVLTPLLSGAPVVDGIPTEGETLTCTKGNWSVEPGSEPEEVSYQWLRNGVAIQGATSHQYQTRPVDEGKPLQCQVTAGNVGGSSVAMSRAQVILPFTGVSTASEAPPLPPSNIGPPSATVSPSDTASKGEALKCRNGAWTTWTSSKGAEGIPAENFAPEDFEWLRDGKPIEGASGETYTPGSEDEGKAIQCQVTAKNGAGQTIADSAATLVSPVSSPPPPLPGGALRGQVFVGQPECAPCSTQDDKEGKIFRLLM